MQTETEFTQKDLIKQFINLSQHTATREELQATKTDIILSTDKQFEAIDKRFEQVDKKLEQVDKRFDKLEKKSDRFMWLLFSSMFALFFKEQIIALLT